MTLKRTIPVVLLVLIGIAYYVHGLYSEKVPQAKGKAADVSIGAAAIHDAFSADELAAGKRFNDKVVAVTGTVREVSVDAEGRATVLLGGEGHSGYVACEFAPDEPHDLSLGATVTIQGFCAGFNMDVLLQRCAVQPTVVP